MTRAPAAWLLSMVLGMAALAPAASDAKAKPPTRINPAVQLEALSCASTGNCSAIGGYDDGLGDSQGLLATEARGRWQRAVEAQAPAGAGLEPFKLSAGGGLTDVSCPAAGDCVAIGRYIDSKRVAHGVIFSEARGRWKPGVVLQLPANAVTPPKPKANTAVVVLGLAGVSCSSVGNCVAVGNYETKAEVWEPLIAVERRGRWTRATQAPLPAGAPIEGQNSVLLSVTCDHSGQCSAAGAYVDASAHQQSLLVSGSGDSWSAAPTPSAPSDANSDPNIIPSSIACADLGECAAVGTYVNPLRNSLGLLLNEAGGQWANGSGAMLPANAAPASTVGDQTVVLSSVACPQAGSCTAVGWYFDNDENGQGLLVTQNANVWQTGVEVTLPSNAVTGLEKQSAGLDWISCASAGNCLATGIYTDLGYNSQGLLLSEVDGSWQQGRESPLPRNASSVQYAAANQSDCTGAGDCAVIGQYNDGRGDVLGYTLGEQGGAWGHAAELALPPVNTAEARLSLLAILFPPKLTGQLSHIRSSRHYVYDYQAVEAGTARSSWYVSEAGTPVLIATGRVRARAAGRVALELELSPAGRTLLAHAKRVHITAAATFSPRGRHSRAVSWHASFTLR